MSFSFPERLDARSIPDRSGEIRAFITTHNERHRLPCVLEHHRQLGVDRFVVVDNASEDGTASYLLEQPDCHVFTCRGNHFTENVTPPNWYNAILNSFGDGHWCLTVDADELFVYPHSEMVGLRQLCDYLDGRGYGGLSAAMVDMYPEGPLALVPPIAGHHFLDICPLFDPEPGWIMPVEDCPGWQMFGGVRKRVFWRGRHSAGVPPCISKIPLVKWVRGMHYLAATHLHSGVSVAPFRAALLHFKFMTGFAESSTKQLQSSRNITEKTLSEREIYLERLALEPALKLAGPMSLRYQETKQLVERNWMTVSTDFERFVSGLRKRRSKLKAQKS